MINDVSIPINDANIVHLDETPSSHKRKRPSVLINEESIVSIQPGSENSGSSRGIITLGADLDDSVIKTTQNSIRDRLSRDSLVENGHTFQLNVKKNYKPT